MRRLMMAAAAAVALQITPAAAQGVPVIDTSSIAQLALQLEAMAQDFQAQLDQLLVLQEQATTLINQYNTLVSQLTAITGPRDIANLLNTSADILDRQAGDSLSGIIDAATTGAEIAGNVARISERIDALRDNFSLGRLADFIESEFPQDRAIAETAGAALAAIGTAEDSYHRANAAMERVSDLIGRIDGNEDIKASIDFNTRMLAEVAVLLNEQIRLMSTLTNAEATATLAEARDRMAAREFGVVGAGSSE